MRAGQSSHEFWGSSASSRERRRAHSRTRLGEVGGDQEDGEARPAERGGSAGPHRLRDRRQLARAPPLPARRRASWPTRRVDDLPSRHHPGFGAPRWPSAPSEQAEVAAEVTYHLHRPIRRTFSTTFSTGPAPGPRALVGPVENRSALASQAPPERQTGTSGTRHRRRRDQSRHASHLWCDLSCPTPSS